MQLSFIYTIHDLYTHVSIISFGGQNQCKNMILMVQFSGSWSKRPHSKTATPKTATTLLATKTATTKTATLYWSKRPQREDHCQNGHTVFGQNGHKGRITTTTATLHLVETAAQERPLPKRPHCIWSKRPQIVSDINLCEE